MMVSGSNTVMSAMAPIWMRPFRRIRGAISWSRSAGMSVIFLSASFSVITPWSRT